MLLQIKAAQITSFHNVSWSYNASAHTIIIKKIIENNLITYFSVNCYFFIIFFQFPISWSRFNWLLVSFEQMLNMLLIDWSIYCYNFNIFQWYHYSQYISQP